MESDLPGLDLSVLLVDLVANQDNGNIVTDPRQILIPFGHVLVGDSGGHIEHENGRIGANIIPFPEPTELFLPCGIPKRELDGAVVGVEGDGADFNPLGGDVLLLELPGDVALDEGGLSDTAVSDQDDLELGDDLRALG